MKWFPIIRLLYNNMAGLSVCDIRWSKSWYSGKTKPKLGVEYRDAFSTGVGLIRSTMSSLLQLREHVYGVDRLTSMTSSWVDNATD